MTAARAGGFTLIEMLVALAVLALVLAMTYGVLGTAGPGFRELARFRVAQERTEALSSRLRLDVTYLATSHDPALHPLRMTGDRRGADHFDELWLLVRELHTPAVSLVHYFLDEERGMLVRESTVPWARRNVSPLRWEMGAVSSFDVKVRDEQGRWRDVYGDGRANGEARLPAALRVEVRTPRGARSWVLPVFIDAAGGSG